MKIWLPDLKENSNNEACILIVMGPTQKFILQTEASKKGLGAVLSLMFGDHNKPTSRKLQPREKKYSTTEKECPNCLALEDL